MLSEQDMLVPLVLAEVRKDLGKDHDIHRIAIEADQIRVDLKDDRHAIVDIPKIDDLTRVSKLCAEVLRFRLHGLL